MPWIALIVDVCIWLSGSDVIWENEIEGKFQTFNGYGGKEKHDSNSSTSFPSSPSSQLLLPILQQPKSKNGRSKNKIHYLVVFIYSEVKQKG